MKKICFSFCVGFFSATLHAEPTTLLKCFAIEDGVMRLACFDTLANAEQKQANLKAKALLDSSDKKPSNWTLSIEQSKIDDSKTVILMTQATTPIPGRFRGYATPTLVLRCLQNVTSAYIDFDGWYMTDISGHGQVTFRIDKEKPFFHGMSASNSNKALGFWNGGTSLPFIKKLMTGQSLLVQATPFRESSMMVTFNISNLESVLDPLRKASNWLRKFCFYVYTTLLPFQ